jgi:hypothetical protein
MAKIDVPCEECGTVSRVHEHDVRRGRGRFCTLACRVASRRRWLDSPEHFWERVARTGDGCWLWLAAIGANGYGHLTTGGRGYIESHCRAWVLTFGPIPHGLWVMHICDTRACCRPSHLVLGAPAANTTDMIRKGRMPRGEARAHAKLSGEQVRQIRVELAGGALKKTLAARFGVSPTAISHIATGRKWRHIA